MKEQLHAEKSGGYVFPATQPPVLRPRRALVTLAFLAFIAIGLMLLPRPAFYYPHVTVEAGNGVQINYLLSGHQEMATCKTVVGYILNAITVDCPECSIRSNACIKNPPDELSRGFDEVPLAIPSTRIANGIIAYSASRADDALLACQKKEHQALLKGDTKAVCYPAGASRPYPAFEKHRDPPAHTLFTLLLAAVGGLIVSLGAAIFVTYAYYHYFSKQLSALRAHPWLEKFTLAGVDVLVLLATFLALSWPASDDINRWSHLDRATVIGHGAVIVLTISWFWLLLEHYARRRPFWDELREIVRVLVVMFMVSGTTIFVAELEISRSSHLIVWMLNFLLIPLGRAGIKRLLDDLGLWRRPAVIVGTGENAREAYLAIKSEHGMGYHVLGFVRVNQSNQSFYLPGVGGGQGEEGESYDTLTIDHETFSILDHVPFLELLPTIRGNPQIILALDSLADPECKILAQRLLAVRSNIHIIPSIRGLPLFGTQLSHFFSHEVLFLTVRNNLLRRESQWIKRAFDIITAGVLLVVLSPLMAYVAWRIWREDGGPVIFRQPRLAKGGGEFGFLKFRSMVKDADKILADWRAANSPEWQEYYANNFKLKNDSRVLGVGSWIRASSIDELPQLVNVLRGEMSLVGPRPLLARELPEYGNSIDYYRQARPGITGLWQISGRSQTKFNDRAILDEWYVQNWSLWYDIAILFKTVDVVLHRRGAC